MRRFSVQEWNQEFEKMVEKYSVEPFSYDLDLARKMFFERIGRAHENQASIYDSVSQSFLEFYLFDYPLSQYGRPAVIVENDLNGTSDWLRQTIFHRWSLFEVMDIDPEKIVLKDLLFRQLRFLDRSASSEWISSWKPEKSQIVQARLFPLESQVVPKTYSCSYIWLHSSTEANELKKIGEKLSMRWEQHTEFLKRLMEAHIRSLSLSEQMTAMRTKNFFYQELYKKYA